MSLYFAIVHFYKVKKNGKEQVRYSVQELEKFDKKRIIFVCNFKCLNL